MTWAYVNQLSVFFPTSLEQSSQTVVGVLQRSLTDYYYNVLAFHHLSLRIMIEIMVCRMQQKLVCFSAETSCFVLNDDSVLVLYGNFLMVIKLGNAFSTI